MNEIQNFIRDSRKQEVDDMLSEAVRKLNEEGFNVEFGKIGLHTTYALISDIKSDRETVGYTFLKDLKFYKENVGQLKALQQAIARKKIADEEEEKEKE